MFRTTLDLPLDEVGSSRFLTWIVALMVYLAVLSLAIAMAVGGVVSRWDRDLFGELTVQIVPVIKDGETAAVRMKKMEKNLEKALRILRQTPGIISAEPLTRKELQALLEPWLGAGSLSDELDIPLLIDVSVDPDKNFDLAELKKRLSLALPGISVDDHRMWLGRLVTLAESVEFIALAIVVCIGLAAATTVVFTTRSGLAVHHGAIEVLHLIGAKDSYIARQFQFHAMIQGLRGGLPGLALAAATLAGLGLLAGRVDLPLLPVFSLQVWQWVVLALLPVLAALITMLTARFTVLCSLAKML